MASVSLTATDAKGCGYQLRVEHGKASYCLQKRFADFWDLHAAVGPHFGRHLPPPPPRSRFFRKLMASFQQNRADRLQAYVQALLELDPQMGQPAVKAFFDDPLGASASTTAGEPAEQTTEAAELEEQEAAVPSQEVEEQEAAVPSQELEEQEAAEPSQELEEVRDRALSAESDLSSASSVVPDLCVGRKKSLPRKGTVAKLLRGFSKRQSESETSECSVAPAVHVIGTVAMLRSKIERTKEAERERMAAIAAAEAAGTARHVAELAAAEAETSSDVVDLAAAEAETERKVSAAAATVVSALVAGALAGQETAEMERKVSAAAATVVSVLVGVEQAACIAEAAKASTAAATEPVRQWAVSDATHTAALNDRIKAFGDGKAAKRTAQTLRRGSVPKAQVDAPRGEAVGGAPGNRRDKALNDRIKAFGDGKAAKRTAQTLARHQL